MPFSRTKTSRSTAPTVIKPSPPPAQTPTYSGPSMMDSIKQGFGLGVGLEAARAAVGGITNMVSGDKSSSSVVENRATITEKEKSCDMIIKALEDCMTNTPNQCEPLLDLLKKCASQ